MMFAASCVFRVAASVCWICPVRVSILNRMAWIDAVSGSKSGCAVSVDLLLIIFVSVGSLSVLSVGRGIKLLSIEKSPSIFCVVVGRV